LSAACHSARGFSVGLVQAHRIEPQLVGPEPGHRFLYFRHCCQHGLLNRQIARNTMVEPHRGMLGKLHEHRAFIERRQKNLAHARIGKARRHQRHYGHAHHKLGPFACGLKRPPIAGVQFPHQPGFVVRPVFQRCLGEHRDQRKRQQQRGRQRQYDRHRHRRK
jgi:hypothetical protein